LSKNYSLANQINALNDNLVTVDITSLLQTGWVPFDANAKIILIKSGKQRTIIGLVKCTDTSKNIIISALPSHSPIYKGNVCSCLTDKAAEIYLSVTPFATSTLEYQDMGGRALTLNGGYILDITYYTD
jgi:hypothetical protein